MNSRQYAMKETEGDIVPHEVIDVLSHRTLVIREMACDLANGWRPRMIMGHCVNQDLQEWTIAPDDKAVLFRIRWSKHYGWRDNSKNVYRLGSEPIRWHRYERIGGVYGD